MHIKTHNLTHFRTNQSKKLNLINSITLDRPLEKISSRTTSMYRNEGITEHAHTTRYVPAPGRGPFMGFKDKLHLYNKNWPYPPREVPEFPKPKKGVVHHGLKDLINPNWPFPASKNWCFCAGSLVWGTGNMVFVLTQGGDNGRSAIAVNSGGKAF